MSSFDRLSHFQSIFDNFLHRPYFLKIRAMPVTNAKGIVNIVPFDMSVQKLKLIAVKYHNDPKFSDRYVCANNADPDQTELHCLLFILLLLQTFLCCKANLL